MFKLMILATILIAILYVILHNIHKQNSIPGYNAAHTGVHVTFNVLYTAISANPDRYRLTKKCAYLKVIKAGTLTQVCIDMSPLELYRYRKWYRALDAKQREEAAKRAKAVKLAEQLDYISRIRADVDCDAKSASKEVIHAKTVAERVMNGDTSDISDNILDLDKLDPIMLDSEPDKVLAMYISHEDKRAHIGKILSGAHYVTNGSLFSSLRADSNQSPNVAPNENRITGYDTNNGDVIVRNYVITGNDNNHKVEEK